MPVQVIADDLDEKWHIEGPALIADPLHPSVFPVVDFILLKGCVVEKRFHTIGPCLHQPMHAPMIENLRYAPGNRIVVTGFLVSKEQTLAMTMLESMQSELRVQQNR